jgi:fructose-specific phosphotransferase system IIA component
MRLIDTNIILLDSNDRTKEQVMHTITELLHKDNRILSKELFKSDLLEREIEASTSMGFGIAIPHTQSHQVKDSSIVFIKLKKAIKWNGDDVKLIFGIAVPYENVDNIHLKILSKLARKLMVDEFRTALQNINSKDDAIRELAFINEEMINGV